MRILVTGGSGKIGRNVLRELASAKHELLNVDRAFAPPGEMRIAPTMLADLANAGEAYDVFAQFRPEAICHLAANPNPFAFPREQIFVANVHSCYNVMQAAGDLGVRRIVYCSSIMAGGSYTKDALPPALPVSEDFLIPPTNAYAMSKRVGEIIAGSMAARYPEMSIATLRPSHVVLADGYAELKRRRESLPMDGSTELWSYVDVRDVATAFHAAVEGISGGHEIFNLAAADHYLDKPLAEVIAQRLGGHPQIAADRDPELSSMDISKMERFFGWKPKHSWRHQRVV